MHIRLLAAAMCCVAFLSACAKTELMAQAASKPPVACDSFVDAGSELDLDIKSLKEITQCERKFHPGGQGYVEIFGGGGVVRRNAGTGPEETKPRLQIVIFRAYGGNEPLLPLQPESAPTAKNFRHMPEKVPVQLSGGDGPATVTRYDYAETSFTAVCVDGTTINPDKSRTLVGICRDIPRPASDEQVMAKARSIVAQDYPAVHP